MKKGGYALLGNDDYFLNLLKNKSSQSTINDYVAFILKATQSKAKFINRGEDPRKYTYSFAHGLTSLKKINDQTSGIGNISVVNDIPSLFSYPFGEYSKFMSDFFL